MSHDEWPDWWTWELDLSPHLLKRMVDRQFSEADLRMMMDDATRSRPHANLDRWYVETRFEGRYWEIIVEPDGVAKRIVVVTAYPLR